MQKNIKSWMFVVEKNTLWAITCSKSTLKTLEQGVKYVQSIKTTELSFYCCLLTCIGLLGSYLHFHCLDDFHYLDHFHRLYALQKNWNLMYVMKLAEGWVTYWFPYAIRHKDARGWEAITNDVLKLLFIYFNLLYL